MESFNFDGFISYSTTSSGELAKLLQSHLQKKCKPFYRYKSLNIFRDTTSLNATSTLRRDLFENLDSSRFLIVICSSDINSSYWMDIELEYWLKTRGTSNLLLVLQSGKIVWDFAKNDFNWKISNALPERLKGVFEDVPLYVDLRRLSTATSIKNIDDDLNRELARLGAAIMSISVEDVFEKERIEHKKYTIVRNVVLAIILSGCFLLVYFNRQAQISNQNTSNSMMKYYDAEKIKIKKGINDFIQQKNAAKRTSSFQDDTIIYNSKIDSLESIYLILEKKIDSIENM